MSKNAMQYSVIGFGLLSIMLVVPMLSGCGQDRPGVRFDSSHDAGPDNFQVHAEENRGQRMVMLMALAGGEDFKKAKRAAINMGDLGHYAEPHLEQLKALADHPDPEVNAAINEAITKIEADIAKQAAGGTETE